MRSSAGSGWRICTCHRARPPYLPAQRGIAFVAIFVQILPMTFKRITCDPKRMNGQPCVRQLRLTVRRVVEAVAAYPDRRELQREFPELEAEDIHEALAYAAANLDDKVIELAPAR